MGALTRQVYEVGSPLLHSPWYQSTASNRIGSSWWRWEEGKEGWGEEEEAAHTGGQLTALPPTLSSYLISVFAVSTVGVRIAGRSW